MLPIVWRIQWKPTSRRRQGEDAPTRRETESYCRSRKRSRQRGCRVPVIRPESAHLCGQQYEIRLGTIGGYEISTTRDREPASVVGQFIFCGNEIGKHPVVDSRSEGPSGKYSGNKTVKLTMCEECAKSRESTLKGFGWAAVALIGGLIVAGILGNFLLGK